MTSSKPETTDAPQHGEEAFRLSPGWVLVGILAVALGIGCGWIMSSATFFR